MTKFSYDELYGVDIDEYCKLHETTIAALIRKSQIDIKIMYDNLDSLLHQKLSHDDGFIIDTIFALIRKKEAHIFALEDWQKTETAT